MTSAPATHSSAGDVKQSLLDACSEYLDQRIATARQAIKAAQDAANEETKSSSGDKFETGRAMMQLEIEKNSAQLAVSLKLRQDLGNISTAGSQSVRKGSLVDTSEGVYFIAISLGKVVVSNKVYFVVAPDSPVGAKLMNLKKGQSFDFNNRQFVVREIF